jgi:cbb3-type cytochrome oxidase subunit 1
MLFRISGSAAAIGYNLVAAMWFALTAIAAYGLLFDLLVARQKESVKKAAWIYTASMLAPALLLIVSNWHGFLDVMHGARIVLFHRK